ncbi:MAG TPA: hypothetical protein V6D25_26355 [Leptolyngbyaceae cyanobacterium]
MKEVLEYIKQREQEFAQISFFQFLRDRSINPYQRVVWFPCLAHFAMTFKDLNNDILRNESSDHPIQKMINQHSYQDGSHWKLYLKDLEALEIDRTMKFSDFLKFMWGEETLKIRRLSNNLVALCRYQTDLLLKVALIEASEATAIPAFQAMAQVSEELQAITHKQYFYFSSTHLNLETGHIHIDMEHNDTEDFLSGMELNEEQKAQAFKLVDLVFDSFIECLDGLMQFTYKHTFDEFVAQPALC